MYTTVIRNVNLPLNAAASAFDLLASWIARKKLPTVSTKQKGWTTNENYIWTVERITKLLSIALIFRSRLESSFTIIFIWWSTSGKILINQFYDVEPEFAIINLQANSGKQLYNPMLDRNRVPTPRMSGLTLIALVPIELIMPLLTHPRPQKLAN